MTERQVAMWFRGWTLALCLAGLAFVGYTNPSGRAPLVEAFLLPVCALIGAGLGWVIVRSGKRV